jgi:hypothetical protein
MGGKINNKFDPNNSRQQRSVYLYLLFIMPIWLILPALHGGLKKYPDLYGYQVKYFP